VDPYHGEARRLWSDDRGAILGNAIDWEGDQFDVRERDVLDCLAYIMDCGDWEYSSEFVPYYSWCGAQGLIVGSDDGGKVKVRTNGDQSRSGHFREKTAPVERVSL
jgi:hypothetical protein